ncbi:MAG: CYTH domain-containing protein [Clostridiales bacterium]|nr:CYTH domain-containing protein [Clostridiales bacterium]
MRYTEIELKYKLNEKQKANVLEDIVESFNGTIIKEKHMKAVYMDTMDNDLAKKKIAFRIREEDKSVFATIKTQGISDNGFSQRKEWNADITNLPKKASVTDMLANTEADEDIKEYLGSKVLEEKITTQFLRKITLIKYDQSLFEIALDEGMIITKKGQEAICELEVELLEGSEDCLKKFGLVLADKYHLEPEPMSKYARGIRLLNK